MNLSVENSGLHHAKACMLKLASHRRWFDTIVIYGLQTFQSCLNDSIKTSVLSAVKNGINVKTVNLDCVILVSLKKQVQRRPELFSHFSTLIFLFGMCLYISCNLLYYYELYLWSNFTYFEYIFLILNSVNLIMLFSDHIKVSVI